MQCSGIECVHRSRGKGGGGETSAAQRGFVSQARTSTASARRTPSCLRSGAPRVSASTRQAWLHEPRRTMTRHATVVRAVRQCTVGAAPNVPAKSDDLPLATLPTMHVSFPIRTSKLMDDSVLRPVAAAACGGSALLSAPEAGAVLPLGLGGAAEGLRCRCRLPAKRIQNRGGCKMLTPC